MEMNSVWPLKDPNAASGMSHASCLLQNNPIKMNRNPIFITNHVVIWATLFFGAPPCIRFNGHLLKQDLINSCGLTLQSSFKRESLFAFHKYNLSLTSRIFVPPFPLMPFMKSQLRVLQHLYRMAALLVAVHINASPRQTPCGPILPLACTHCECQLVTIQEEAQAKLKSLSI